ncbi:hypothetical protein QBC40DRAFT_272723 [Triangularia verruculosa]|uniref:Uncharacterized protein n=1 Tax=Triangularia verruculosa TaxID=2587418 RepID=A0AAN6XRH4_9PEZI|nr:hypothetical protein QBC40DRAFT_272723 [Triangularia verruculosa]
MGIWRWEWEFQQQKWVFVWVLELVWWWHFSATYIHYKLRGGGIFLLRDQELRIFLRQIEGVAYFAADSRCVANFRDAFYFRSFFSCTGCFNI